MYTNCYDIHETMKMWAEEVVKNVSSAFAFLGVKGKVLLSSAHINFLHVLNKEIRKVMVTFEPKNAYCKYTLFQNGRRFMRIQIGPCCLIQDKIFF